MRSDHYGVSEASRCPVCGEAKREAAKYCGSECYHVVQRSTPPEDRFWSKVNKNGPIHPRLGTACWLWTGSTWAFGHGQFTVTVNGRQHHPGAHVYAYTLKHGPLPDGVWVLHHCDNPPCVRDEHLFTGDQFANMADAAAKGRLSVPRPKNHKLTVAQIEAVRERVANGELQYRLAEEFNVTTAHISMLVSGRARQYDAPLRPRLRRSA